MLIAVSRHVLRTAVPTLAALWLTGCAALHQGDHEDDAYREPGSKFLGAPVAYTERVEEDRDFAWLADAAYSWTPAAEDSNASKPDNGCLAPQAILGQRGWSRWPHFPSDELGTEIWSKHLRVEVWFHPGGPEPAVAVSFCGTVINNRNDWLSNLRWFLLGHTDEYSTIVDKFAPEFSEEFRARLASDDPQWQFLRAPNLKLYSTGHSLGGGLAQQFAYAWPIDAPHRVDKVYAYDPSPVTGFGRVPVALR